MKLWNHWTRRHDDGWVERRHRILKAFAERIPEAEGQKVPAVAGVAVPEPRATLRNRGEK